MNNCVSFPDTNAIRSHTHSPYVNSLQSITIHFQSFKAQLLTTAHGKDKLIYTFARAISYYKFRNQNFYKHSLYAAARFLLLCYQRSLYSMSDTRTVLSPLAGFSKSGLQTEIRVFSKCLVRHLLCMSLLVICTCCNYRHIISSMAYLTTVNNSKFIAFIYG